LKRFKDRGQAAGLPSFVSGRYRLFLEAMSKRCRNDVEAMSKDSRTTVEARSKKPDEICRKSEPEFV
jgi:hypothetical protein